MLKINNIYQGDCLEILKTLPDKSIDCCITSPPYWNLRDYQVDGQLGLEKTPEEYVANMVKVFCEVKRVLKKEGVMFLNLGDSYNGSGGEHRNDKGQSGLSNNRDKVGFVSGRNVPNLKPKDLVGIPWRVAFALQADGWYLRSDIIWHKPNPMPESVKDRCTKSHEYIFLLSKNAKYYYDADAIKEPYTDKLDRWGGDYKRRSINEKHDNTGKANANSLARAGRDMRPDKNGSNKRSVWTVSTQPYKEAHFATFPEKLIEPMILAGCSKNGLVLDPFMGAGTVGVVAKKLNRNYIGIELNPEYVEIANRRIANTHVNGDLFETLILGEDKECKTDSY